jgi:single-strand DNA-binding protein
MARPLRTGAGRYFSITEVIHMTFTYNRVTLVGRAGSAPEVRFTQGGQRVATLNVATDRPVRAASTPVTDWHRIVCWDRLAEIAAEHVVKGRLLFIEGSVTYRAWQDQQRQNHTTTEIVARELILLDRPPAERTQTSASSTSAADDDDLGGARGNADVA